MTPQEILSLAYQQDSRWGQVLRQAEPQDRGTAKKMKKFLDKDWSKLFAKILDDVRRGEASMHLSGGQWNVALDEILKEVNENLYPKARKLGFPEWSFALPDITLVASHSGGSMSFYDRGVAVGHLPYNIVDVGGRPPIKGNRHPFAALRSLSRRGARVAVGDDRDHRKGSGQSYGPRVTQGANRAAAKRRKHVQKITLPDGSTLRYGSDYHMPAYGLTGQANPWKTFVPFQGLNRNVFGRTPAVASQYGGEGALPPAGVDEYGNQLDAYGNPLDPYGAIEGGYGGGGGGGDGYDPFADYEPETDYSDLEVDPYTGEVFDPYADLYNHPSGFQEYDPATDAFYSDDAKQEYDPETDSFYPAGYGY